MMKLLNFVASRFDLVMLKALKNKDWPKKWVLSFRSKTLRDLFVDEAELN